MHTLSRQSPSRRPAAKLLHVKSPLTRAGYGLARDEAQLVLLQSGRIRLRGGEDRQGDGIDGPRLLWLSAGGKTAQVLGQSAGQKAELLAEGGTRASIMSVPMLALTGALPANALGEQMRRTLDQDLDFPLDGHGQIAVLLDGLQLEQDRAAPGLEVAGAHYLSLILLELWRYARADLVAHGRAPQGLAERFVLLAGQRLREHLTVGAYADLLGVSRDRLGSAVRRATGHSPQSYLHALFIREASELLASTGMPVGQVAFRLGFSDPAYFTRFFTRHRGESPAKFRRKAKALSERGDTSYAAWP